VKEGEKVKGDRRDSMRRGEGGRESEGVDEETSNNDKTRHFTRDATNE